MIFLFIFPFNFHPLCVSVIQAGVFLIENHIFPKEYFEASGRFKLTRWSGVPGVNILEHIHREEPNRNVYHPYKLIIQPR